MFPGVIRYLVRFFVQDSYRNKQRDIPIGHGVLHIGLACFIAMERLCQIFEMVSKVVRFLQGFHKDGQLLHRSIIEFAKAGEGWGSHIIQFQPIELFLIHHRSSSQKLLQSFKGMTIYAFNKVSTNSQTDGGRHCPCEADPTDV